jgi:hypothetical protein
MTSNQPSATMGFFPLDSYPTTFEDGSKTDSVSADTATGPICPACGGKYAEFRTGLTFRDVRRKMFLASVDCSRWRQKRRHSVLGYWRELKLQLFEDYHHGCTV